ncbi:hypothetical protein FACS1894187_13560 [Synergistales bacterium]|nr:hypothetical protein FACS1894187_13560 [Synergistales bacterium]
MERIFTDASYLGGQGGMSVIGPLWSLGISSPWRSKWKIRMIQDTLVPDGDVAVFYAACRCADSNEAEQRALGMAFLLGYDILGTGEDEKVEIITDSLIVLDWVTNPHSAIEDPMLTAMRNLWRSRRVILSKVKGHAGNAGNDLADKWAKRARAEAEPRLLEKLPFWSRGWKSKNN